jgi:hypothetical protein
MGNGGLVEGLGVGQHREHSVKPFWDLALSFPITINEKVKFMRMWRWSSAPYSKLYGLIFAV